MSRSALETDKNENRQEAERLAALDAVAILDTPPEPEFDAISRLVATYFGVDSVAITFADENRVWVKSSLGLRVSEWPRKDSLFNLVLAQNGPVVISDISEFPEMEGHLLLPRLIDAEFIAAVPVCSPGHQVLGELVISHSKPREEFTANQLLILQSMANIVAGLLELRKSNKRADRRPARRTGKSVADRSWPDKSDLRRALDERQFVLYYQPEFSLATRKVVALEALIRWKHPERGMIPPLDFIPIAEENGLIVPIGDWVLTEACNQMQRWCSENGDHSSLRVCVNLSARQFCHKQLADHIEALLSKTRVPSHQIGLELTESSLIPNLQAAQRVLRNLRELGVSLLLDDFGTGFSSLNHLHSFPFDALKIDRSFVSRIVEGEQSRQIVRTIVELARTLGMDVIAEGLETREQYRWLRRIGCRFGQGYLLARPMSGEDITELLRLPGRVLPESKED